MPTDQTIEFALYTATIGLESPVSPVGYRSVRREDLSQTIGHFEHVDRWVLAPGGRITTNADPARVLYILPL